MSAHHCHWCGRFGGRLVTYQLWPTTPRYVRYLCRACAQSALDNGHTHDLLAAVVPSHQWVQERA